MSVRYFAAVPPQNGNEVRSRDYVAESDVCEDLYPRHVLGVTALWPATFEEAISGADVEGAQLWLPEYQRMCTLYELWLVTPDEQWVPFLEMSAVKMPPQKRTQPKRKRGSSQPPPLPVATHAVVYVPQLVSAIWQKAVYNVLFKRGDRGRA